MQAKLLATCNNAELANITKDDLLSLLLPAFADLANAHSARLVCHGEQIKNTMLLPEIQDHTQL